MTRALVKFRVSRILHRAFVPRFSEVSLYSMSLTCLLLIATHFHANIHLFDESIWEADWRACIAYAVIGVGLLLSLFHAFSRRRKSSFAKVFMLLFASLVSGFGGIWAGTYLWYHTTGWLRVIPLWNIVSGYMLLASVRDETPTDDRIADVQASLKEVLVTTLITVLIFAICQGFFKLHWAATFSLTVAYATNFNGQLLPWICPPEGEPEKA